MNTYFVDLGELCDFALINDGSLLFDEQYTAAAAVEQQPQRQHFNSINVEKESMQSQEECYRDANNTTTEETHQYHDNNNHIMIDNQGFLLLNHHHHHEDRYTPSYGNDTYGLEEQLLKDDNEMLDVEDIIIEDQMLSTTIPTNSELSSSSTLAQSLNGGGLINIEPPPAFVAYDTGHELQKITKWDPSSSYIHSQPEMNYVVLHDDNDILQDFSNNGIKAAEVEIDEASGAEGAAIVDNFINEGYNDFPLKTVINGELTTGSVAVNSPSTSVSIIATELQQRLPRTGKPANASPQRPPNSKKKTIEEHNGPIRYMLYDGLIATIVDFDTDETPIVMFSQVTKTSDNCLPVECGICPEVMTRCKLYTHLKTHYLPETNRYACIYCENTYRDFKYLAGHARRHMGIRPYICCECKLYFVTKQDLRVHNQRRHIQKSYICEICGKDFAQNTQLKRHRERTHEKSRRFHCLDCSKAYFSKFSLEEHVRVVHMHKRRKLICRFCGMQCFHAHELTKHRRENHLNQKTFTCYICCEEFTNINYFDAHKRSIQCRNNTRRQQEGNDDHVFLNNVENKENFAEAYETTNQSSYSTNRNLNSPSKSQFEQQTSQRHQYQIQQQQQQQQEQQQNHHQKFGDINVIVPDVVDYDEMEKAKAYDEEQHILVERPILDQENIFYEISLGSPCNVGHDDDDDANDIGN